MYLSDLAIIDRIHCPDAIQDSMGSIKKSMRVNIMGRLEPFGFEDSPQGLGDVKMRRVWREEKDIKASFFPFVNRLLHLTSGMDTCIVENDEGRSCNCQREVIDKIRHILGLDTLTACKTVIDIVPAYHAENIEPCGFHGRHKDVLLGELPAVRDISLCAYMALVSEVKVNESLITKIFKFLQLLALDRIELRRGCYPWAFGYTLISCARTSKKRLKVISLAFFPDDASQRFLAAFTLCRSCDTASRTRVSSVLSIIGFRPCPGFVLSPAIPSAAYLFVQLNTEGVETSSFSATSSLDSFSLLRSIERQRTRNLWSDPCLYPLSNARRSSSDNIICFFLAMIVCIRMYCHTYNEIGRRKFYNK